MEGQSTHSPVRRMRAFCTAVFFVLFIGGSEGFCLVSNAVSTVAQKPALASGLRAVSGREGVSRKRSRLGVTMVTMEPPRTSRKSGSYPRPGEEKGALPWRQSIAGPQSPLTYMVFMETALNTIARRIPGLQQVSVPRGLDYAENREKGARIVSLQFTSPDIRKARLTYFDAGDAVQVFNMVIYPDARLKMPVLGVDLISFGKKHLAGIDFQPLLDGNAAYNARYLDQLKPIKAKYPGLDQKISQRFYDSAKFFSPSMLFARYEDQDMIEQQLFPAFSEYLDTYLSSLRLDSLVENTSSWAGKPSAPGSEDMPAFNALERQQAYDQYNAERDPAHGLFVKYFGDEWSEQFMDHFLFDLSVRPEGGYPKVQHGGPPCGGQEQQQQQQQQPQQQHQQA